MSEIILYPSHTFKSNPNTAGGEPRGHVYYPKTLDTVTNSIWNNAHIRSGHKHSKQAKIKGYYGNEIKCGDATPHSGGGTGLFSDVGWKIGVTDHYGTSNSYHASNFDWGYASNLTSSAWKSYGICPYGIAGVSFRLKNTGTNNADAIQIIEMKFIYRRIGNPGDKSTQIEDKLLPNGDNSGSYKFRDSFTRDNSNAPSHNMDQLKMNKSIDLNCWVYKQEHGHGRQHRDFDAQYGLFGMSVSFWVGDTGSPDRNYEYTISHMTPIWALDASKYSSSDSSSGSRLVYPALTNPSEWYGDGHGQISPMLS